MNADSWSPSTRKTRPNVVLIFLDDSGWADFEPFANPAHRTPNVYRLAQEDCRFNNFYATAVFGKWHLGDQPETRPPARGFDESCGLMYSNDMWEFHPGNPEYWGQWPLQFWDNGKIAIERVTKKEQPMPWFRKAGRTYIRNRVTLWRIFSRCSKRFQEHLTYSGP